MSEHHASDDLNAMLAHTSRDKSYQAYRRDKMHTDKLAAIWREWAQLLLADAPTAWSLAGLPTPNVLRLAA